MYKKPDTFQKARQFPLCFLYTKSDTLDVKGFSWNFWSWHWYTKIMTLCVTWHFYIQKARHLAKSKTICDTFLYTKIRHYCVTRFFVEFLKLRRGWPFIELKNNVYTLRYIFILKNSSLCVTLLYTKSLTLCVIF